MKKQKKHSPSWISGYINWFDPHSGKGSIISDDGVWYRINEFSEIQSKKDIALKEKARVEFALALDSIHPIIKNVRHAEEPALSKQERPKSNRPTKARSI